MNSVVKEIQRLNAREAQLSTSHSLSGSWHDQYKESAHIFVGGLPFHLTEGDILCVLSQFGELAGINLVRDKDTGKSRGFAFLKYVDQRSTVLAVDNMNGAQVLTKERKKRENKEEQCEKEEERAMKGVTYLFFPSKLDRRQDDSSGSCTELQGAQSL